jgi:hypothetical protein
VGLRRQVTLALLLSESEKALLQSHGYFIFVVTLKAHFIPIFQYHYAAIPGTFDESN